MHRISTLALFTSLLLASACHQSPADPHEAASPFDAPLTAGERGYLAAKRVSPATLAASHARLSRAPVRTTATDEVVGRSRLIRFDFGVLGSVRTEGLEPGTAVTLWMVVFNVPANCSDGICGSDDLRNPAVRADLLGVDGTVIRRSGRARLRAFVRQGDTTASIADPLLGLPARGVEDAEAAEIHFVVRTHGALIPGLGRAMTSTFNGGCTLGSLPDDPGLGPPGPNTCANLQAALHLP